MHGSRFILLRGVAAGLLAAGIAAGGLFAYVAWYTGGEKIIPGVQVGGSPVGGLTVDEATQRVVPGAGRSGPAQASLGLPAPACDQCAPQPSDLVMRHGDRRWVVPRHEVGGLPDTKGALSRAQRLGREGSLWNRTWTFAGSWLRGHYVPMELQVREDVVTRRLLTIAEELYIAPRNAVYDDETDEIVESTPGRILDVAASRQAIRTALLSGAHEVDLIVRSVPPELQTYQVRQLRRYEVARFTTPILSADSGRVKNITLALQKLNGQVIDPGETFSFNRVVGPRDADHGWAPAKEIYNGEFVLGYGGGICQVSSTLYNAVLLSGLAVVERFHHSRPLAYIRPGLDATVYWNALDFKFRNTSKGPIILTGRVLPPAKEGDAQRIQIRLLSSHPRLVTVSLEAADERFYPPEHAEIPDPKLAPGERVVIDEGYPGIEVKIYRVIQEPNGYTVRELVSTDKYQPKAGKVRVGVGRGPTAPPSTEVIWR